jgi:REP element-mobilizing transposase RayT
MRDARIAEVVADSLRYWDAKKYRLIAWCVMPNHVHVVLRLFPGQELPKVVHSWKTYSAKMANRQLNRSGSFWQREYYDRLVRDGEELERAISYILRNPEQAGLAAWPWAWSADVDVCRTAGLETGAT